MSKVEQGERFISNPVEITAIQWTGNNEFEIAEFMPPEKFTISDSGAKLFIDTPEGCMEASILDWIIKGTRGEFYPCQPDVFAVEYRPVSAASLPESQPAPEMDQLLRDFMDYAPRDSTWDVWHERVEKLLRAHDARVHPDVSVLMDALKSIADPPHDACGCEDHECEDCCVNADYHCPECIAGHAIANFNKSKARVQPSSVAGTDRLIQLIGSARAYLQSTQTALTSKRVFSLVDLACSELNEAESALKESSHGK